MNTVIFEESNASNLQIALNEWLSDCEGEVTVHSISYAIGKNGMCYSALILYSPKARAQTLDKLPSK
jgi:hypothetical protein